MSEGLLPARRVTRAICIDTVHAMLQVVELEYDELFGGEVEAVHVVYDMADLNKLCKEYTKLKDKLADLIDDYTSKKRRHKKIKPQKVPSHQLPLLEARTHCREKADCLLG